MTYSRRRLVDWVVARRLCLFTVPAALVGSLLADRFSTPTLRRLFGCVAVAVAYLVFRSGQRRVVDRGLAFKEDEARVMVARGGPTYRYAIVRRQEGAALSTVGAVLLGMTSVGLAERWGPT